jgi:hypothetical protein
VSHIIYYVEQKLIHYKIARIGQNNIELYFAAIKLQGHCSKQEKLVHDPPAEKLAHELGSLVC